jgi:hypothetical protein
MDPLLEQLRNEVAAAHAGMTSQQLSWHPPGKWSAGEILEHLYLTYTGTTKGFGRVTESGAPKVTPATLKQRIGKIAVLGFSYLPSGRAAPSFARPRGLPFEKIAAEISDKITEMDQAISLCEQKLGRGLVFDHVILGPLSAAQWRKFHLVHGRHHLKQIHRLRKLAPS